MKKRGYTCRGSKEGLSKGQKVMETKRKDKCGFNFPAAK